MSLVQERQAVRVRDATVCCAHFRALSSYFLYFTDCRSITMDPAFLGSLQFYTKALQTSAVEFSFHTASCTMLPQKVHFFDGYVLHMLAILNYNFHRYITIAL